MSGSDNQTESAASQEAEQLPDRMRLFLRRADQVVVATIILLSIAGLVVYFVELHLGQSSRVDIRRAPSATAEYVVELNSAKWPELANLPGIGEQLARAIVDYREENGPFEHVEQLCIIDGIGEKKLENIRQYVSVANPPLVASHRHSD